MAQLNTLELAKQGDVKAIAFLLNRQLQPKGITATVSRQDSCLQVMLEAARVPNQQVLTEWIHKSIIRLGVTSLEQINIYGRQTGVKVPAWNQKFELVKQSPPVTAPTEVKSAKSKTTNPTQLSIKECVEKQIKCEEDLHNLLYKLSYFPHIGKPVYLAGLSQLATYLYDQNNYSDIEIIIGGRYKTKIAFLLIRNEKILIYIFAHSLAQTKENYQRIEIDNNFDCVLGRVEKLILAKNGIKIILKSNKKHSFYLFYNAKEINHEIKNKLKTILKKRILILEVSIKPDDEYEARKKSIMVFSIFIFLLFMLSFCSNIVSHSSIYQYTNKDRDTRADVYECADEVGMGSTVQPGDIERMDSCLKRKGYSY